MNDNADVPPESPTASSTRRALLQSGGAALLAAAAGLPSAAAADWPVFPMPAGESPADSPSDIVVQNEWLTAIFGLRGLKRMQLSPKVVGKSVQYSPFLEDGFFLQFDKTTLDSRFAAAERQAERKGGATVVRYRYEFGGGNVVTAVYEFLPDWRFVAKRLVLETRPSRDLRIKKIAVFAGMSGSRNGRFANLDTKEEQSNRNAIFLSHPRYGSGTYTLTFFVPQNPFTEESRPAYFRRVIAYTPDLLWREADGPFVSDALLVGPWQYSLFEDSWEPVPEWQFLPQPDGSDYFDAFQKFGAHRPYEVPTVTACVRAFLKPSANKNKERNPRLHVGWCENDYQIDVATGEGRAEYGRIFAMAAAVGVPNVLFTPTNSALSSKAEATDAWGWENLLWLGLGEKIRKGEWDPRHDKLPDTLQALLDDARRAGVRLAAYVYPSLKFRPEWNAGDGSGPYGGANSANRDFQDWLVETMVAFQKRTGVSGFSLDYWWLAYKESSVYAQWDGCRRILEALRERLPDTIIDGRQSYQGYGPWTWLAGSYPHPTGGDEQPASFRAFPDLHIDRVYGNHQRWAAYHYRVVDYCPTELVPGFMIHQTQRFDAQTTQPMTAFRTRDWDYLGWKYSVLSSIGSAPCNHVVNYLPARDPDEAAAFSTADKQWLRDWLDWTDTHRETLIHLRPRTGPPAIGFLDANAAIVDGRGFLFVFNPNLRPLETDFPLLGIGDNAPNQLYVLRYITPAPHALIGRQPDPFHEPLPFGFYSTGDRVQFSLPGGQAVAVEVLPAPPTINRPFLFDVPATASVTIQGKEVTIMGVRGPFGGTTQPIVVLPPQQMVETLRVNGVLVPFRKADFPDMKPTLNNPWGILSPACTCLQAEVHFAGAAFDAFHAPIPHDPRFAGGAQTGTFTIPARIFAQLRARRAAWPIPYTADDLKATWLGSDRLLLFVQIAEPKDTMPITLRLDDAPLPLEKAYTSIYGQAPEQTFVGWYVDVSHLEPNREYRLAVSIPPLAPGQFQGVYFENVETETTDEIVAPKSAFAG